MKPFAVFISYAHEDSCDFAHALKDALERNGKAVWIDTKGIPPASLWKKEIPEGIEGSIAVISIISPGSIHSKACQDERQYAKEHGKKIIPVLYIKPHEEPEFHQQYIDFRESESFQDKLNELLIAIDTDLEWKKIHTILDVRSSQWKASGAKDTSLLMRGGELEKTEEKKKKTSLLTEPRLTPPQQEYISASHKAEQTRKKTFAGSITAIVIILCVCIVIASIGGGVGFFQSNARATSQIQVETETSARATAQADTEQELRINKAVQLAIESGLVQDTEPQKRLLLAMSSLDLLEPNDPKLPIAESSLRQALYEFGGKPLKEHFGIIEVVEFSPNNQWLVSGGLHGEIFLRKIGANGIESSFILDEHENGITAAIFSRDEKWLISGSYDHTIRMWDIDSLTRKSSYVLEHQDVITVLAISPDNRFLVSGSSDGMLNIWDITNQPQLINSTKAKEKVTAVEFSPNGRWLASGSWDGTINVWQTNKIAADPVFSWISEDSVSSIAFSANNVWLASGGGDRIVSNSNSGDTSVTLTGEINLWNLLELLAEPITIREQGYRVYKLAFSPDTRWLASATGSDILLRDLESLGDTPLVLKGNPSYGGDDLEFSPNGRWLAIGSGDNAVRLWDLKNPLSPNIVLRGHEDSINTISFSPNNKWLASGSSDKSVRFWNLDYLEMEPYSLNGYEGVMTSLVYDPKNRWLITGGTDNLIRLWDLNSKISPPIILEGHTQAIGTLAISPNGQWLASGSYDNTARLWDLEDTNIGSKILGTYKADVSALEFSPNGNWLSLANGGAFESGDGFVYLWNINDIDNDPIRLNASSQTDLVSVGFSSDGQWLVSGSQSDSAHLWNLQNLEMNPLILEDFYGEPVFSPNGRWLAGGTYSYSGLAIRDMQNIANEPITISGNFDWDLVNAIAFSPNSRWIAAAIGRLVVLLDMESPNMLPIILQGHQDDIVLIDFSPDSTWLASAGVDSNLMVWDLTNPQSDGVIFSKDIFPLVLTFSPDNKFLISESSKAILFWRINIGEVRTFACEVVGRNFTNSEWEQYFSNEDYRATCPQW